MFLYRKHKLNRFFYNLNLNQQLLKIFRKYIYYIIKFKFKSLLLKITTYFKKQLNYNIVKYILSIFNNINNIYFYITDCLGNSFFCCSILTLNLKKKSKFKIQFLEELLKIILVKYKILKFFKISMHFNNFYINNNWFLLKIRKKLFLIILKNFIFYPYNGCKRKKIRKV